MKFAQYDKGGKISILEAPKPSCPQGGFVVQTEACGLCSGELMTWYMDLKAPHVFGHEVAGIVVESQDDRFAIGDRVFVHHHSPCFACEACARRAFVHCPEWKKKTYSPGGMAEFFAVEPGIADAFVVGDLPARDAALIEPLACVLKGIFRAGKISSPAVIGAGALGLMHGLCLRKPVLYELREDRRAIAQNLGLTALHPKEAVQQHETIFVCPGSQSAFDFAASIAAPDATIVLFAPLPDGEGLPLSYASGYFKDLQILHTYSCGPDDTAEAFRQIKSGVVTAEKVVSDFVSLDHLPEAYASMKAERILKAMVLF